MTDEFDNDLRIDDARRSVPETGFYVRARGPDGWESVDIAWLDETSLRRWLLAEPHRSFAVVLMLLGHPAPGFD